MHCYSFHSVKGGVGKSTLAICVALYLADQGKRVTLIDLDAIGTSLVEGLPMCAPQLPNHLIDEPGHLLKRPTGMLTHHQTLLGIAARHHQGAMLGSPPQEGTGHFVPFLNDFLLLDEPVETGEDVPIDALSYRLQGDQTDARVRNLRLIPTSALPVDLEKILPRIQTEPDIGFIEGRLEILFDALLMHDEDVAVVFDTPPALPGLTRTILSLAFRLGRRGKKRALSSDNYIPSRVAETPISFQSFLVMTLDRQDVRAGHRWLQVLKSQKLHHLCPVFNLTHREDEIDRNLDNIINPARTDSRSSGRGHEAPRLPPVEFAGYKQIRERPELRLFRDNTLPAREVLRDIVKGLLEAP